MKKWHTIEQLKKSIIMFSVLSILTVGTIVAIVAIYPLFNHLKKQEERSLLHAVKTRNMAIEQFLGKLEQTAWQITSRSRIRDKLEEYNRGEVNLQQLVDFTKPKLRDALNISKEADGCVRLDKKGEPVVQVGLPIPKSFWVVPEEDETRVMMHGPITLDNELYLVVGAPIFNRKKERVGTDVILFQLSSLRAIVQDYTGLGENGETILGMVADKTHVRLFFPPRNKAEKYSNYVNIGSPIGMAIEQASHLTRNDYKILIPAFDPSQVFAYGSIPNINWAIVGQMNAKELYAPINRQIIVIVFVILALILLCTLGTLLLLHPLTGKIIIHTEELRSVNQQLVQEVEERKRSENVMEARLRLLEFANTHSTDELLTATLDEIEALTGSAIGFYHFLEADQKTLSLQNWSTNTLKNMCTATGKGSHYDVAQAGVWVDCISERRPVIHNDYASLPHRRGLPEGHAPVLRELVVPIFRGNLIKAIIGVGNKATKYYGSDIEIVSQLGDLSWDIVERKRAEEALRESEERFRDLYENAPNAYFSIGVDGLIRRCNRRAGELLGYAKEDLVGRPVLELYAETAQGKEKAAEVLQRLMAKETVRDEELEMKKADGKPVWISLTVDPVQDAQGMVLESRSMVVDITARQRAEAALRDSETRYRAIVEAFDGFIYICSQDYRVEFMNDKLISRTGYDATGELCYQALHERDSICPWCVNERVFKGETVRWELKSPKDDRWYYVVNTPIYHADGTISKQAMIQDITERKQAEQSIALLSFALNNVHEAAFLTDEKGCFQYVNEESCRILGYTQDELLGLGVADIDPDFPRERWPGHWDELKAQHSLTFETRHKTKDGGIFPVEVSTNYFEYDGQGYNLALARDITARKQTEEALQQSEQKFRLLYDNAPLGYQSLDEEGLIIEVNRTWLDILGYTREEVIGRWICDFLTPPYVEYFQKNFPCFKETGEIKDLQFEIVRRDGTIITASFNGKIAYDAQGRFLKTHCMFQDITARKRAEEALRESEKRYRIVADNTYDWEFWISPDGQFLYTSPSCQRITGHTADEFAHDPGLLSSLIHPEDRECFEIHHQQVLEKMAPGEIEFRMLLQNGSVRYIGHVCQPVFDDQGLYLGKRGSNRDITERKHAEEELRRIEWMLSKKHISAMERQEKGLDQGYGDLTVLNRDGLILKSVGRDVLKSIAADYLDLLGTSSAIYEANGDYAFGIFTSNWCRMLDCASRKLCDTDDNAAALGSGQWLCHESCWAHCSKETIATRAAVDIECSGGIRLYGVPIVAHEKVIGSINFGYGDTPKDPAKLRALANAYQLNYEDLLAAANAYDSRPPYIVEMAKSRLHATAELIGILVERKQAEETLRKSENRLAEAQRVAHVGYWERELDTGAVTLSDETCRIFGLPTGERILNLDQWHEHWLELVHPEDRLKTSQAAAEALGGGPRYDVEYRVVRPNGEVRFVHSVADVAWDESGRPSRLFGMMQDITEHKQTEEALRQVNETLRATLDAAPVAIIDLDTEGRVRSLWNPAAEQMLGWRRDEVLGQFLPTVPEESKEEFAGFRDWVRSGKSIIGKDTVRQRKDGSLIEYSIYAAPEYGDDGRVIGNIAVLVDITERKQMEQALALREQEYRTLLDNIPDLIVRYDLDLRRIYVNPAWEKASGLSAGDVINKPAADIPYVPHPVVVEYAEILRQVAETGTPQPIGFSWVNARGATLFLEYIIVPEYDRYGKIVSLLAVGRDITERKQAEEAVAAERQRFYSLLEAMPAYVGLMTPDYRVDFANLYFRKDFGEPEGRRCYDYMFGRREPCENCQAFKVLETEKEEYEWVGPNGRIYQICDQLVHDTDGSPLILEMGVDITERKQAEEEIRKLNLELEQRVMDRTAQLEAANQELEAFAYSVSHDLRAPLRHVDGFLELLQKRAAPALDGKSQHYLANVFDSTRRMGTLIDDLLSFSRMGRWEMLKKPVELNVLVKEVIQEFEPETRGRRIRWHVAALPVVTGDLAMLRIALVNLISNALKFTRPRQQAEIEIGCLPGRETETIIYIRDNGVGFDMNYADNLFGVFQRLHRVEEFEGTGIGLANVRRIINRHGGRTWAEGKLNQGATFYFSLP
jgi:PAS domain S-box-containing protein